MRMSKELEAEFNTQIAQEFFASHSYLQMAAYCENAHLPGFAQWLRFQAQEEHGHAMRFYDHVLSRGNAVQLHSITQPRTDYGSVLDVFEEALAQEQSVTRQIQRLYGMAMDDHDYPSFTLLQWFINEQVEEEANCERVVAQLRLAADDTSALLMLDNELGARSAAG